MACELGSMPIVEYMVSKDPAVCRITLVDYRGMTPLHLAASKNQVHVVEFLLEKVSCYFFIGRYIFGDDHRLLRNLFVELRIENSEIYTYFWNAKKNPVMCDQNNE